jgi:SNF2 family DNA or RNA helicase
METATLNLVLEPLSKATETALKPAKLDNSDMMFLSLDKEGRRFICRLGCVKYGLEQRYPGPSWKAQRFMERFPEKTWHAKKFPHTPNAYHTWTLGGTDFTALIIYHGWDQTKIRFAPSLEEEEDEDTKAFYQYLIKRFLFQTRRASIIANFKLNEIVPEDPPDWLEHDKLPLTPYQKVGVLSSLGQSASALFLDRGTGKTPIVIQKVCMEALRRRDKTKLYRALIVCPPQVRSNWLREFNRFAALNGKAVVARGGPTERIKCLIEGITNEEDCEYGAVIISYDSLSQSISHFAPVPWDLVVLDESHYIKSPFTKRWKTLKVLRETTKARVVLTGTPIGNSPMDLWAQLEFLDDGMSGFQSFNKFKKFHGKWADMGGPGIQKLVSLQNVPLLQERLSRLAYSLTKKEAKMQLPEKTYDEWEVEMTPEQAKIYSRVCNELKIEIENLLSGEVDNLTVERVLTRLLRLSQITSGHIVLDQVCDEETGEVLKPKKVRQISTLNPKVEAVVEMLQEQDELGKTIVWCTWVENIRALSDRLDSLNIVHGTFYGATTERQREENVRRYNEDPNFKVLVCNPAAAGEGLNLLGYDWWNDPPKLQTYTNHEIFFSCNWSYLQRAQAEDRAHRRGTRTEVRITDLVVPGTIDEEIRDRVQSKEQMATTTLELREILKRVL